MTDSDGGPVDRYLDRLFDHLAGTGGRGRRALHEADDHLRALAAEAGATGLSAEEAERVAVERFGAPGSIAAQLRLADGGLGALLRPAVQGAWLVAAVGLLAIGVSGLVAELLGRVFGMAFVAGDGPGVTYTAERCAYFQEYIRSATCAEAATIHHFGEVVEYRVAAGALGLLALLALLAARRATALGGPEWTPRAGPIALVLVALFGVAGAVLGGLSLMELAFGLRIGVGANLSAGLVAAALAASVGVWAVKRLRASHV